MRNRATFEPGVLVGALLLVPAAVAQRVSIVPLGDLPGGGTSSQASAMTPDAQIIVGRSAAAEGREAFLWTAETGMTGLGDLPGGLYQSEATGVSADGWRIVGMANISIAGSNVDVPFQWISTDQIMRRLHLNVPSVDAVWIHAASANANGQVFAGNGWTDWVTVAFRAQLGTEGGAEILPLPYGVEYSTGMIVGGLSADGGTVVGVAQPEGKVRPYRWTREGGTELLETLGPPIVSASLQGGAASTVSGDGKIVYGRQAIGPTAGITSACRWDIEGGLTLLPLFFPSGANYDGSIAVGGGGGPGLELAGAVVFDDGNGLRHVKFVLLDDYGFDVASLTIAPANTCSADGRKFCAGVRQTPDGDAIATLVTLPLPGDTYADLSGDSRVDAKDVLPFTNCMKGPGVEAWGVCRTAADLDGDGDVDLRDYVKRLQVVAVNACGAVPAPPPPGGGMPGNPHALPGGMADVNLDCSVDGDDAAAFVDCLTGPSLAAGGGSPDEPDRFALSAACSRADVNGDDAVDLRDVVMLQRAR